MTITYCQIWTTSWGASWSSVSPEWSKASLRKGSRDARLCPLLSVLLEPQSRVSPWFRWPGKHLLRGLCELRLPGTNPTSSSISITLNHFSVTNLPNGFSTNWQMVETKLSPSLSLPSILRQLYCNVYHDLRTIYGDFFQQVSLHYSWPNRLNYFSFRLLSLLQVVHYFWVVVWFLRQAARGWGGILLFVLLSSKTF